jgi:aryl-alcohol dehydrogenase-like predicted oxidoreductase
MSHLPSSDRYARMRYVRCGKSGLKLPAVSLGLWHNFGGETPLEKCRAMIARAFDLGITHFDLANRYLEGIPADSRAAGPSTFLTPEEITEPVRKKIRRLNDIAAARGQSPAQMALAWVLRGGRVTSVVIGASKPDQIDDCVGALKSPDFSPEELSRIDAVLSS